MPALESRGSISRTQHVPVSSASGYSAAGMGGAQAILTTTAVAASEMVNYMSKSLFSAVSKEKKGAPKQPSTGTSGSL